MLAADCSAFFLEEPFENMNLVFFILTPTLKIGLCLGPVFDTILYSGRDLNFFNENSCNLVFASITVSLEIFKYSFHVSKTNSLATLKPLSKYIAAIIDSHTSEIILFSIFIIFFLNYQLI